MARAIMVNLLDIWGNNIEDAIENNKEYLDFSVMPYDEFKEECINLLSFYFDNEMLSIEPNYNNFVLDTARDYEMLREA